LVRITLTRLIALGFPCGLRNRCIITPLAIRITLRRLSLLTPFLITLRSLRLARLARVEELSLRFA
jgi:hypothetical protein|tara:strand:+ start:253 stop:450 length:198 start_codon:yes stop_codon:yes gene_type:complete